MAFLAEKLHHEYYWLLLAPVVAVGIGRALDRVALKHGAIAVAVASALLLLCGYQVRSTWWTPLEWNDLEGAARTVSRRVPRDAWVVAPEALLFQADRRGCRMEWTTPAARRAQPKSKWSRTRGRWTARSSGILSPAGRTIFRRFGESRSRQFAKGLARVRPATIQGHCG